MNLGEVLALGPPCEVCHQPARQLYPLTRYDPTVRRFRPVKACVGCCGPARDDDAVGRPAWRLNVDLPKRGAE